MVHDLGESLTGDVIRTFKYATPAMKKATSEAEEELLQNKLVDEFPLNIASEILLFSKYAKQGLEGEIIALCDFLCVFAYCEDEIKMGNKNMKEILNNAAKALKETKFSDVLKPYVEQSLQFVEYQEEDEDEE